MNPNAVFASAILLAASSALGCIPDLGIDAPDAPSACDPEGLDVLLEAFPPCDLGMCGPDEAHRMRGRCVDTNQVPTNQRDLLGSCDLPYPALCVPAGLLIYDGRHKPVECVSLGGLEGRCMSECVPQVQAQGVVLPDEGCGEGEKCAPCYDPTTGESTGACDASHCDVPNDPQPDFCAWDYDAAPIIDTALLAPCAVAVCDQPSHCMPNDLVPEAQRALLGECDAEHKCVPDTILVSGGNAAPPTCTSVGGAEGRCMSTCIPEIYQKSSMLPVDVCNADTERCAPCTDPISGESTGACGNKCDMPTEPPVIFAACCEHLKEDALCVPEEAVPGTTAVMRADTCASGDKCIMRAYTDPCFRPQPCANALGDGFCMNICTVDLPGDGGDDTCPTNTECIACSLLGSPMCDPLPEWCP